MRKPNIPEAEKLRQEKLESYKILDTLPEKSFDDLTLIASQIAQTPIALISLIDKNRQWFKSKHGLEANETSRDISFCGHAINEPFELFEVNDAKKDDRFKDNPLVTGKLNIGFYAGIPLVDDENFALGTLCVIDNKPKSLNEQQKEALHALAREVMHKISIRKINLKLKNQINKSYDELVKLNQKYYQLYHDAPDMMASVDPESRKIVHCNKTLCFQLGYEPDEIINRDLLFFYHPDCHEEVKKAFQQFINYGEVKNKRLTLLTKKGNSIQVALNVQGVKDDNGKIVYSNSIWRDISETIAIEEKLKNKLNETEKFLLKVTDIAPALIYVFNQETMSNEYANKEIGEILGYSEKEVQQMGNQLLPIICHSDDLQKVFDYVNSINTLEDKESVTLEYRVKHKDGKYRWLLTEDAVFERDSKGRVIKHMGVATDITKLKESQKLLADQAQILRAQNDDLKQFTYVATHDLRSPIITLESHFEYLKPYINIETPEVTESIEFVEEEINGFKSTLHLLTDAIKLRETEIVEDQYVDLNTIVRQVIIAYDNQIKEIEGDIKLSLCERSRIVGNQLYVKSIVQNLISNAIKYRSLDKPLLIEISSQLVNEYVELMIKDNGIGMDLKLHQDRLFKMFNQFHTHSEGHGMGLYMVKNMVKKIGGNITIESKIKQGTTFTIQFLLKK